MKVTVGSNSFDVTLDASPTVNAFRKLLPLTVEMSDLHGNEKFVDLPVDLPVKAGKVGRIQSGDLMLYGLRTLVVFYDSFPTTYSYTKLGRIDDARGLATAVGTGSARVTFTLKP